MTCPLCDSNNRGRGKILWPHGDVYRVQCNTCGLIFFSAPRPQEPVYDIQYNAYFRRPSDIYKAGLMAQKIADIVGAAEPGKRILEVGPGNGLTAYLLQYMGYQVQVREVDPEVCKQLGATLGLDCLQGKFEDHLSCDPYRLIYAGQVIEHCPTPIEFWQRACAQLDRQGYLLIDTPDANDLATQNQGWKHYNTRQLYEHCCLYNLTSLRWAAQHTGLDIVYTRQYYQYGSIEVLMTPINHDRATS